MVNKNFKLSSDLPTNFSSTATLTNNDQIKVPISRSIDSLNDVYNPYDHRILQHPNTFTGALLHILKGSLGTGILAVPRGFKSAGLLVGAIGTVLIGLFCTHTVYLLVSASQKVCVKTKTPSLGFAETAEAVFANGPKSIRKWSQFSRIFVEVALSLTHFVGNSVYVVFISESMVKLVAYYHPEAETWGLYFKLVIMVLLVICCQIRELKHLVPFSFVANATIIGALGITMWYMFKELTKVNIADRNLATSITGIPSFYSTLLFAMEGIGTIMPVENTMTKSHFIGCPGVLNSAMTMVVLFYGTIGFCGYYSFGEDTKATITQNLPSDKIPAQVVQALISIAIFFSFMLQYYVPMDITWRRIRIYIPQNRHNIAQVILRASIVICIVGVAAAAGSHLGALIDLLGAIFFSTLGLFIPAFLDIIVNWKNWGTSNWILYKDLLLIILFLFGLISGTYYAALNFIE